MSPRFSTKALLLGLLSGSSLAYVIQRRQDVPTSIIPRLSTTETTSAPATATSSSEGKTTIKVSVSIPDNIQPVIDTDFPDPAIIQGPKGKWWAFGTSAGGGPRVRIASADSPNGPWTYDPDTDAKPDLAWTSDQNTWAPDVQMLAEDSFVLYYSAPRSSGGSQCLGAARASTPSGPYTPDSEPLMCRDDNGGVIDISGFLDPNTGKRYITYKLEGREVNVDGTNYITPLFVREVSTEDGTTFLGDEALIGWRTEDDGYLVEAPQIIYRSGHYILFYSSHAFNAEDYDTKYAVADSVTGPYERKGQLIAAPQGGLWGPGGAQAVSADGVDLLVFHGWCNDRKGRCMYSTEYTVEEVAV
jgi:hypothetical protein